VGWGRMSRAHRCVEQEVAARVGLVFSRLGPGLVSPVILVGVVIGILTCYKASIGRGLSRTNLQYEGAVKHLHARASVNAGRYLILR
jgi:hypothetical protein